jgi:MFS family permease
MLQHNTRSNIAKLYIILSFRWLLFIMPILVLFFYDNGLNQAQVMILQSIFSVGIFLFEIPSGYFSDVFGRRTTILLGSVISTSGFIIYSFSYGFWGFLAAELTLGLGASFISGTDSAMLYDTLIDLGLENEYSKIEGRRTSVCNFSETVAAILGGLLATVSLRLPFYVETIFVSLTIFVALTLVEPPRRFLDNSQGNMKAVLSIVRFALKEHLEIKWLIIYSSIVGSSTLTMVWFIQPYLKESGLPLAAFGIVWAVLNFSVGIFSLVAYRIERTLGKKKTLLMLLPLSLMGYVITGLFQKLWAIPALLLFYFVRGIHGPVLKDYVNRLITSDKRATVLSVKNMLGRSVFTVFGPFVGWVNDVYSLKSALLLSGGLFMVIGGTALIFLRRHAVI